MRLFTDIFSRAREEFPDRIATEDGDTRVTYAELHHRALAAARRFVSRGVRPGEVVALVLPDSIDHIVAWYGLGLAGAVFLDLDPSLPPEDRARQMEGLTIGSVLVDGG